MNREDNVETPLPSTILLRRDHAFIPSLTEIISLSVVSLLLLTVSTILPIVQAREDGAYRYITDTISNFIGEKLALLSGTRWATFMTALVWMLIGMAVYLLIWAAAVMIHAYRNDIPASKGFVVPEGFARKSHMANTIARILARTFGLVSAVLWVGLILGFIFPQSMQLFIEALTDLNGFSIVRILGALLLLAFSMYVLIILTRVTALKRRIFGS